MNNTNVYQGKLKLLLFILLATALVNMSCKKEKNERDPLVLGAVYNLTGAQAALDVPSSQGAQLALLEINSQGGIDGEAVQMILRDGETNPDVLRADVNAILEEQPSTAAFLGLSDTDQVLAAAAAAAKKGRVFMTSGATSPQLPAQVSDYLFLTCFGDNVQAAAAAEYAFHELGARSAAIVYDSSETYTNLLQGYFLSRFEQLGGQGLSVKGYDQQDMSGITNGIEGADIVFFSAMPQSVFQGVQQIRQAGFDGPIVGGDAYDSESLWKEKAEVKEVFFTTHAYLGTDNTDPKVQQFRQAYVSAFPGEKPSAFAALGYDTVRLLVKARQAAGSSDPDAIRSALGNIRDFEGITGTISFGNDKRIPTKTVSIMEVKNGGITLAAEIIPDQVPAP